MKTYLKSLLPSLKEYSHILDDKTELTKEPWILINDDLSIKEQYIFRKDGGLIHSVNGRVEKGKWELLSSNVMLIDLNDDSLLMNWLTADSSLMILQVDNTDEVALFVKSTKYHESLQSLIDVTYYLEQNGDGGFSMQNGTDINYYYLENLKEHGPYNIDALEKLYFSDRINHLVFVRTEFENDYSERTRLQDIIPS